MNNKINKVDFKHIPNFKLFKKFTFFPNHTNGMVRKFFCLLGNLSNYKNHKEFKLVFLLYAIKP